MGEISQNINGKKGAVWIIATAVILILCLLGLVYLSQNTTDSNEADSIIHPDKGSGAWSG